MTGAAHLTDEVVQAAAIEGPAAVNRIVSMLNSRVRSMVAVRLAPDGADVSAIDDIAQKCLLGLATGLPELERRCVAGLNAYLSSIVRNRVADYVRGRAGAPRPPVSLDSTVADITQAAPLWEFVSIGGPSPRTEVECAELRERVVAAMRRLPPDRREILILAFYDQLGTTEIAAQMGISRSAVAKLLREAIRALRRAVTGASTLGGSSGLY